MGKHFATPSLSSTMALRDLRCMLLPMRGLRFFLRTTRGLSRQ
ncbi:unnamed protein product [Amoebophrya sp. A120]|nr:unnamed protein product [Amoebophrya sp. A120]|eukprot:GSA120T00006168001.1